VSEEANKALSRRLYDEVFGNGNLEAADEILGPDALSHGGGVTNIGPEQIKRQAMLLRTAIPDLATTLKLQFADGDLVVSHWLGTGTFTGALMRPTSPLQGSGQAIAFEELRIDRFDGGRIVESWFIPDRMTLWQQMGLVQAPS
jgi:predicted ester cyclase